MLVHTKINDSFQTRNFKIFRHLQVDMRIIKLQELN